MSSILFPIPPLNLDPRNTVSLAQEIQSRIYEASGQQLNDFTPSSPLSAITEGQAFAQGELLYYMNNLPEAWTLQWLRIMGIQRILGSTSSVELTFFRTIGYPGTIQIPFGTRVSTSSGLIFSTLSDLIINDGESLGTVLATSTSIGSRFNVSSGEITTLVTPFVGISSVTNFNNATGGADLESIDELKNRAFEFIKKRGLVTKSDFESYVASLIGFRGPVFCLNPSLSADIGLPSNSINILVSELNGKPIPSDEKRSIILELNSKSPLGSSISIIDPVINPVSLKIEISSNSTTSGRVIAQNIYSSLSELISPSQLGFGSNLNYTDLADTIRLIPGVSKLLYLEANIYSGLYTFNPQIGSSQVSAFLDILYNFTSEDTYINTNPISSFRLYTLDIYIVPGEEYSSGITYSYGALYDL